MVWGRLLHVARLPGNHSGRWEDSGNRHHVFVMSTFLAAAGINDPYLVESFQLARRLNARHGRTYYLATFLLPAHKRPFVHALYGLARYADDIVDTIGPESAADRSTRLERFRREFLADLRLGRSAHPIGAAAVYTARFWDIDPTYFEAFFHSMAMDLHVASYQTFDDLLGYTYGSAAVIGLQLVPILEPTSPKAISAAQDLGTAFQLANFIRDVGEDLDRDRIYLPLTELAEFGVTADALRTRRVTDDLRAALAFQIARVRELQARAEPGIDLLARDCQPGIRAASTLYCGIVDEVERNDYDVFSRRATVPLSRRLLVAAQAWRKTRRT